MLDHLGIHIHDYDRSKKFYQAALAPMGFELIQEINDWAGFGWGEKPDFWIKGGTSTSPSVHIAFSAEDRQTVRDFYQAALDAGGKDNGAPGLRPEYHADYYSAYVLDPDGHNIEVVCHIPSDLFAAGE